MFQAILLTHWKWVRLPLLVATLAAFAVPLLSMKSVREIGNWQAAAMLDAMASWSIFYPALAAGLGLVLAWTAWSTDHRLNHVYALSLPVSRVRFTALRLGAGALLLAAPAGAMLLGSTIATLTTSVPAGLTAYPLAISFRFAVTGLLAYSLFSAISAGSNRTAGVVLGLLLAMIMGDFLGTTIGFDTNILDTFLEESFTWPSPLHLFSGRWMLVDI
ncbi:MAG: hypothetical protein OEZ54_12785 [Gemmatimonadota bacterium]|nr:hypothetical protein [Gemmatimonadota bacterium]